MPKRFSLTKFGFLDIASEDLLGFSTRDHCHILNDFRGAAHNRCNLNFKIDPERWKLPILFHDLKGYDGHILI